MLHNIWIATDLHLFNKDADNRHPHRSEQEMNQITDNYGNMIQEDDLFIFLGDLYDPGTVDASEVANYIHNIKGYKIMCRGNHDTESYDFYRELGFDDVCDILRIHNLIFSHKPVKIAPDELNIHGDLHTKKLSTLGYQYINAYASNYNDGCQPVLLDDLIDSALVQNSDQIKPLDKVDEKFEEFTSNRTSVTYRNVRDLSDQFSLAPMDESASKKDNRLNLFFVSEHGDYNETIVQPKIPDNYMTQNGFEDNKTPRVCFSTSIDGCLMALSQNITDKVFYVYQPVGKHKVITPTEKQVPDVKITKERWICEPVELTSIGKIKAIDVNGPKDDGIPYCYGPNKEHEARLYAWGYRWLERFNESISPSIVSLSAEVKEDEDEEHDPMNEILFPDVDSTQYWEADDSSLDKKLDGQKFADDRPTHKMIGKNDVAADGESTLDEDVNFLVPKHPEMIIKTQYLDHDKVTPKTISILAKDLFGERAMIHPEYLDQQKLATMKTVNELVDYFNSMAIFIDGSATRSPNGVNIKTPNFVVGAFLFTNRKKNSDAIPESELDQLLPNRLSNPEAFKEYINNSVEALNELEEILCSMICANLAMIRISINDVINQLMTPGGKKTIIKRAKDYIDDHMDEFVTKFSDGTVCYDYKKLGIDCEVFVSDQMYNGSEFKKINRPSRFLVRTAVYDKILVVHGATEQLDHCKYKWTIEPITIYGKQYTDLDDVIKLFKTMHAGRILVLSCNTDGIVPDNALYDIVDYASGEVIFESTSFMINKNGSPEFVLKSIQRHAEKRIKELNNIESKVLSEIDSFDIVIAPEEFSYVEIDWSPIKAKLITKQMPNNIKKYKKLCGTTTDKLFKFYKEFMFVIYQYAKRLVQTSLSESGYHWDVNDSIEVEDLLFHEDSSNYQSQSVIDNPTGGYHYETLDECMHDVALYAEASGNSIYSFNINGGVIDEIQAAINEDAYEWLSTHNMEDHPLIKRINDIHSTPSVKVSKIGESEVFFTKEITPESLSKIFSLIYMPGNLPNGWKNMVKISTGEPGGNNYLKPELIGELVKRINGVICDTVTAYDGNRDTKEKQLKTMKDHGFTDIGEVDVLDGDGELVVPVKDGLILKESLAGSHIMDYDFYLILTHFKGHAMAGFGGAIKNVAIGCSSRRGKSLIHTYGSTADMTIGFGDEYDQQTFLKAMVDAAKSYVDLMKLNGPILYINIANNLSVDCDCNDHPADPTMEDIGIFASWDPVAVDQACIDAVYHAKDSHDLVERIESKDGTDILLYAEDVGLGTRNYELINIDSVNETANGLETVDDEIKVGNESLTIKKKVSENPNDPVGKLAHDLAFYLDGKKIAEISISAVDSNKAFLYNFEVNSKYRGKGYGTAILKYVLSHYKVNELTVDKSNTKAIKLYKRFGFKTGVEFKEDGKTRVDMKINLNESAYVSKHQFNGYAETLYHLDAFRKAYQVSGNTSHGIPDSVDTVCTFFEDILDNYNQIAPETLDRDKVAACKSADDLIELFYDRAKQFGDDLSSEYTSSLEMLHHLINLKKNPKNNVRFDEIVPTNLSKDKFAAFIAKRVQEMDDIEAFLTNALKSNLQMYGIIRKEIQMLESDSTNKEHVKALKAYMDKHEDDFVHIHKKNNVKTYEYDFDSFGRGKVYVDNTIYETSHDVVKPTRLLIRASMYDYIVYSHGADSDTQYAIDDIVIDGQVFNNVADIVTYLQKGAPKRILIMACNNNQVIYDSNDLRFANVKYPSHEIVLESALNISSSNPNKMLKEWDAYLNNRLGILNRVRKRLVHQISDDEFVLYPNKCKLLFARSNAKDGKLIYQESFSISDRTMFVNAVVSSIESIVRLYEQVCFTCKMMIRIIHDAYNDTLTEAGYGWEIKPVTGMSWSPDDYRFGYQYHTMQECFHDLTTCHELFFESTNCCGRIYSAENPKHWCFTSKTLESAILEAYYKYSKSELQEAINQLIHAQNETKEYLRTDNIHAMSREEEKNVAEKYGLRAVGQEVPAEEEKRRQTPEERYAERNKKRQEALKKARKAKKRKAFARKVKSHLPFVNNEEVELIRESESAVDTSDVDTPDGVEHSPLYGDKKDFFYNYDYPKSVNAYAERLKLEESTHASTVDPDHKQKGKMNLGSLKRITMDEKFRKANVGNHAWLKHFASSDLETDVSVWLKNKDIVAAISVDKVPTKRNRIWIHNLHIEDEYRGYGLAKQLLDYAVTQYGANVLAVKVDNMLAQKVYLQYGFKFGSGKDDVMGNSKIMYINESFTVYHGSPYKLSKLKPTSVYKGENALFASPNYTFALCYAGKHWTDQDINQCIVNGYVVLTELKNGIFDKVFDCSGYIYEFDSDDFTPIDDGNYEMYRVADIKPSKTHRIANVYQALVDAGVELRRYPAAPPSMNEAASKSKHEEDPLTKKELAQYGIRDLRTFQRWLKNNVKYKNMTTLMSPREVLEQKRGSCHDQVVLELAVLKALGYSPSAYFVLEHDNKPTNSQGGETHSYVVVKDNGKLYWLENAWSNHAGLNEVTNPKFIIQAHQERVWGDFNKFPELEVVHFAGQYGDSLQELVDHCFNDKQEESKEEKKERTKSIRESYQFELIGEQVKFIDHLDESVSANKKLYPVYIVLVHSGTAVSNAIKFVSKSEFSHASISFDSSLDHMYSFARKDPSNPFLGGFRYESIGKGFYDKKEIPYALYVVPCTANQIKKMKKRLNYFIQNESKFQFDFAGLVKNYLGIVDNPEYRWFCSRFVADILNAGAPKNKPYVAEPSLQDPDDFKNTDYATYVIGGSNLMKYNRKLVDKRTNAIIREAETAMSIRNESVLTSVDPMNPYASMVLNYQFAMMDESVVDSFVAYLKSFKLKFDKDGNLIIRRREYDQLDQHFRTSLRLMKAAEKAGDTGTVKDELCKINYMINLIQTQYMNQKTTDKNRKIKKEMEDLRSVMYNAFHQHLKWVVQMDPQFNFNSYYNSSKYGKDVVVDKKILTAAGKTIVTTLL